MLSGNRTRFSADDPNTGMPVQRASASGKRLPNGAKVETDFVAFAEEHRLRLKRDDCGDKFIPCRRGQIFDPEDRRFGVMLLNDSGRGWSSTVKIWNSTRRMMQAAGFQITQDGDEEGAGLFEPIDAKQLKVAFKVAQPYRRKKLSEEHLATLQQDAELAPSVREALNSGALQGRG